MAFIIPYRGCKIRVTTGIWENGKESASFDVVGANNQTKEALARHPIKGKVAADKALDAAKHKVDDLLGRKK